MNRQRKTKYYTSEENQRAYQLFCAIDCDNSGTVDLGEIRRVLLGERLTTVSATFPNSDNGLSFKVDDLGFVAIDKVSEGSPASTKVSLLPGLRMLRVNDLNLEDVEVIDEEEDKKGKLASQEFIRREDRIILSHQEEEEVRLEKEHEKEMRRGARRLRLLQEELLLCKRRNVNFLFSSPDFFINQISCYLDIEYRNRLYSIPLQVGAYYSPIDLQNMINAALTAKSRSLRKICSFVRPNDSRVEFFHVDGEYFRLMFESGPNVSRSCRFALGFGAIDTDLKERFTASPLHVHLDLGLEIEELDLLIEEIFQAFDDNGNGFVFF